MWPLLVAAALAATPSYTCGKGDQLDLVVAAAGLESAAVVIVVDTGCGTDGIDHLSFATGAGGVTDWTLTGTTVVDVPPIRVTDGVDLTLEGVRIATTSALLDPPAVLDGLFDGGGIALLVHGATLHVTDVTLAGGEGVEGAGLVLVDGTVDGTGLTAEDYAGARALYAIGDTVRTTVYVGGAAFRRNGAGAVVLWGDGQDVQAHFFDTPLFEDNGPAAGADLAARDVFDLTVASGRFTGSTGVTRLPLLGAPVSVDGGSFTCTNCTFIGTSGETASVADVEMDGGDVFSWTNGEASPDDAVTPVLRFDRGGDVILDGVKLSATGQVYRAAGTTTITNVTVDGHGGTADHQLLKLTFTDATIDGLRVCNYGNNGWGLIGTYGSSLVMWGSRFQDLDLGGNAVVKAWPDLSSELVLKDNTLVASDATFVGGSPAGLTFVNNLVANTAGGVAIETVSEDMVIDYNLWSYVTDLGTATGAHDRFEDDPGFVAAYDPTNCSLEPDLAYGSAANGTGDPSRPDEYGNTPSDIGARDYDDARGGDTGVGPDDTGDTDGEDTDGEDTDGDDTGGADTDGVDTDDPPAPLGLVGGALPPCGCGTSAAVGPWAAFALLACLSRRRSPSGSATRR